MSDGYVPTCELRFVNREDVVPIGIYEVKVVRKQILQQKWVSTYIGEDDQWRDVPAVEEP